MAVLHTEGLEDVVPGTVYLVDVDNIVNAQHLESQAEIVLVPTPSSDPEDPLNWSKGRKRLAVGMAYTYTIGLAIASSLHYSVLAEISADTGITIPTMNLGTGLTFLFVGWVCLLWQPPALVFGRRGVYIMSSFLSIIPVIWAAYSKTSGEWLAHRILYGLVAGPIELLPEVTVTDLFFAHDRGTYTSIYAFLLLGGNFFAPVIGGWINVGAGWRWVMYFGAIWQALATIVIFFFMEETMYFRATVEGVAAPTTTADLIDTETNAQTEKKDTVQDGSATSIGSNSSGAVLSNPKSYWQKLSLFVSMPGRPSIKQMFTMTYRPLLIIWHFPCVAWAGFLYGTCLCWYNILNATSSSILSAPPYNFSSGLVGTAYLSPVICAFAGAIWGGWFSDKLAINLARRNNGVREPEQRLWGIGFSGIICAGGLILWGVGAAHEIHWFGLVVGLGMLAFSVVCGASIAMSYDIDCFKELGGETLISVIIIRNTMGFAISYAIDPWITTMGLQNCFITVAMVALVATFTFLPIIFFGKRLRKFSTKKYWEYVKTSAGTH